MPIQFLLPDGGPFSAVVLGEIPVGLPTRVVVHLFNPVGAEDLFDVPVFVTTEGPNGQQLRSGVESQDNQWIQGRWVGHNNTANSAQLPETSGWFPLGAGGFIVMSSLYAGCYRHLEIEIRPTSSTGLQSASWALGYDDSANAVSIASSTPPRGVLPGVGDMSVPDHLIRGAELQLGPASDEITCLARLAVLYGAIVGQAATTVALDQNDSAALPLAAGECYFAAIGMGTAGLVAAKGDKGVDPALPALPGAELLIDWVKVRYQAGGVSVIEAEDIQGATLYGRFLPVAGDGAALAVHPGRAVGAGSARFSSRLRQLALDDNATSFAWLTAAGLLAATSTAEPPSRNAEPLAEATVAAGAVTSIVDRRRMADGLVLLQMTGAPGPGTVARLVVEHPRLYVEQVAMVATDGGGGTDGETVADWTVGGATAYTSQADDDQRPRIAYNSGTLRHDSGIPELTELRQGDVLTLETPTLPTGGNPASVTLTLVCRAA